MRKLDGIIRKIIAKRFPIRGQAIVCMTEKEFNRRFDNAVTDLTNELFKNANKNIAQFGSPRILLEPAKAKLLTRIAWIVDEDETREERPKKVVIPKQANRIDIYTRLEKQKVWNDGYDSLRTKRPQRFEWKKHIGG